MPHLALNTVTYISIVVTVCKELSLVAARVRTLIYSLPLPHKSAVGMLWLLEMIPDRKPDFFDDWFCI